MTCRVSGAQWTISPTKLDCSYHHQIHTHLPPSSVRYVLCITSWIGSWLPLMLGNAVFVIQKPTDGCLGMMGSHYIHHFTRTDLCNMFLTCSGPLTRRWRCQESFRSRRERTCLTITRPTAPYQEIADVMILYQMSERSLTCHSLIYLLNIVIMADICSKLFTSKWSQWGFWLVFVRLVVDCWLNIYH